MASLVALAVFSAFSPTPQSTLMASENAAPVCWLHNPNDGESTDLFMRLEASSDNPEANEIEIVSGGQTLGVADLEPGEVSDFTVGVDKLAPGSHLVTGFCRDTDGQLFHVVSVTVQVERPSISATSNVAGTLPFGPTVALVDVDVVAGPNATQWCIVTGQPSNDPIYSPTFDRLLPLTDATVSAVGALSLNAQSSTAFTVTVPVISDSNGKFPRLSVLVNRGGKWVASRAISVGQ